MPTNIQAKQSTSGKGGSMKVTGKNGGKTQLKSFLNKPNAGTQKQANGISTLNVLKPDRNFGRIGQ